MSRTAVMNDYASEIGKLPPEAILGDLMFFTISAADVHLEEARANLVAAGLSTDGLRKALRPIDAFRKSSRETDHGFKPVNGVRSTFMVRQVGEDSEQSYRHIMLERAHNVSGEKRRILYEKVGEYTLNRGTKKNGVYEGNSVESRRTTNNLGVPLTNDEDEWLTSHLADFEDRYDHLLNYMDSHAVRSFVREYIYRLSGTCVKESGGLYFIKHEYADKVEGLADWVHSIGSEFHSLPLMNLAKQKKLILEAFEDEAINEVQRLMSEVKKILADSERTVEEKTFDNYALRAAELKQKVKEYHALLGSRASKAVTEINVYTAQLNQLAGRIKDSKTTTSKKAPLSA